MSLLKNPKKYGDLHKKWKSLKKDSESNLKADIKKWTVKVIEDIKAFEKDPGKMIKPGDDVEAVVNQHKQNRIDYLDTVFDVVNCDRKKAESPSFSKLFPDFDKGFGPKLDAYEKAAGKGAKDTDKKREAAKKVADKYETRIKAKVTDLKKFNFDVTHLKKCQSFLEKFNADDEVGALNV
jgi:hypothetical protein